MNMNMPIDLSKNVCDQISKLTDNYILELVENGIPYYEAITKAQEEMQRLVEIKMKDKKFHQKLADDMIKIIKKDDEIFKKVWEFAKEDTKIKMDRVMDDYSQGKISKEEMESTLKLNSIVYEEIEM